jgi:hypothetical protein
MEVTLEAKLHFITSIFGAGVVNKGAVAVTCPKCSKDNPEKKKLIIQLENGLHHCWVCELKGKTLTYTVKKYAPDKLDMYFRIFESGDYDSPLIEEVKEKVELPADFVPLGPAEDSLDPDIQASRDYCFSRGLTERDIWYFKLGACSSGKYRRRIIMPSFDANGDLNYITARSIDPDSKYKYMNSKAEKKSLIFNEINIDWKKELTIVEGPFDLVKCDRNSVTLLGSGLNEGYELFKKIVTNMTPIVLALDPDASDKSQKICSRLYSYGIGVRVMDVGPHKDVGEMSKSEFLKRKEAARFWSPDDHLQHLFTKIRSGSLL